MLPTVYKDSQCGLGLAPRTWEARVDASGIVFTAGATSNRSARYRSAGMGRGGYAP